MIAAIFLDNIANEWKPFKYFSKNFLYFILSL